MRITIPLDLEWWWFKWKVVYTKVTLEIAMTHSPLLTPMFQNVIDMDLTSTQLLASEPLSLADSSAKVAYLAAAVLFVLSLAGLSKQTTARRGNLLGIIGMLIAISVTLVAMLQSGHAMTVYTMMAVAITAAVVVGAVLAVRVPMTGMPELVAMLHSFVGLAAVLVGISSQELFLTTSL